MYFLKDDLRKGRKGNKEFLVNVKFGIQWENLRGKGRKSKRGG